MEKKYLSDCIRYTTDIAPYPFIQIYSGVGSGKNTFVDALAKGYEESQPDGRMETLEPKRVLCITSRRAKVDELKNAEDAAYGAQVLEYEHTLSDTEQFFRRNQSSILRPVHESTTYKQSRILHLHSSF